MKRTIPIQCNKEQCDYILKELSELKVDRYRSVNLPAHIKKLRKRAIKLDRQVEKCRKATARAIQSVYMAREREIAAVRKEVYFGTPESALRMLEALQRKNSNRK